MATDRISGYQPRQIDYGREQEPKINERPLEEPTRSPEEIRAENLQKQRLTSSRILGNNIDIYA